jgi:hypothetical protein
LEPEGGAVNTCQISPKKTIRDLAQRIIWDNISEKDIKVIFKVLAKITSNTSAGLSRISRLRRELRGLNASEKIISATLDEETTCASNKTQKERRDQRENEGIDFQIISR